jgi:DNA modification methylase
MIFIDQILEGNNIESLKRLPDKSVDCCVTSPPYFMQRHYSNSELEIGREDTPKEYVNRLCDVFDEVKRVLKDEGSLWLNLGDTYAGSGKGGANSGEGKQGYLKGEVDTRLFKNKQYPSKSLIGIPWMTAFGMIERGWILREDIVWSKPSPLPEPCTDRFVRSHEFIFLFVKQPKYYFNHSAALEPATGYDGRRDTSYKIADYDKAVFGIEKKARERWSQRGYVSKEGEQDLMGQTPQYHGSAIKPRYFGKAGNTDRNDTGNPFVDVPLRTRRDVWTIASEPSREGHYAMYPQKLVLQCLICGCPEEGVVLDPFMGSGTTAIVARKNNRHFVGCELNHEYVEMARRRVEDVNPLFGGGGRIRWLIWDFATESLAVAV